MKRIFIMIMVFSLIAGVSLFAENGNNGKATAPGLADTFSKGMTTIVVSDTTEIVTTANVLDSYTETRAIGQGQGNGKGSSNENNLQDRTVTVTETEVDQVRTVITEQHHGTANSSGKYIGTETSVTTTVLSKETTTETGDWGAAYSLPSEIR